jgi:RND family efflux transporter MFP subunit
MLDATVFSLFSLQAISQVFGFAIDVGLKSVVICAAALLLDRALGRRVLVRSAALNASLIGLVLLPASAVMLPQIKLNLIAEQAPAKSSTFAPRKGAASRSETRQNAETRPAAATSPELAPARSSPFAPRKDVVSRSETRQRAETRQAAASVRRFFEWRAILLLIYATVALTALFRLSRSLLAVASLKRSGNLLAQPAWNERLAHWQARLGVSRPVELLSSDRVDVPVVVGWRRPAILTPLGLAAADPKTIDAILLHELAHVRRGDYAWNLLLRLVQALYWPNPLLWLVGRSLSRVREQACDEVCIHWLGGSEDYRATLLELAGILLRRPLAALGMAMAGGSRLQRRLEQLGASRGRAECQSRGLWRFAALAVAASIVGALGAVRLTSRAAAGPTDHVHVVIDKVRIRADESKARKDRNISAVAVAQADLFHAENAEGSASTAPAEEAKEEQPRPAEKQPETPSESKPANAAANEPAADEPAEPIKVRVEKVRREDFIVQTTQPGTLKPSRTMELYARIAGLIAARHVNVGDVVKAGQVLAEIEAPELYAELEQAKALAEEAPAAVEQAQGKLDEAAAAVEGAQARVVKCEAELSLAMRKKEPIPIPKALLAAAKAEVKQSEAAVAVAKAGLRIAQLHLTTAQQALKRVELRARFLQIMAPADGVVVRQAAEPGSFAKLGGEPLFVISGTKLLTVQTQIPEIEVWDIAVGQHAIVQLDARGGEKPYDAKVSRIGYALTPDRTLAVEIDLDNADGRLRPGMNGMVTIDLETHPGVLTLPKIQVFWDADDRICCFRVVDGRGVKTEVEFGWSNRARMEIKRGLKEGDVVIAEPGRDLDGVRVEVVDQDD